jgi:predicted RNA-binding protein with PIN domain
VKNIFIDGYNVINCWPKLRKLKTHNLEIARNELIEIMQNYATYNGYKVFVVFDAHMVKGSLEKKEKRHNVLVVFTKEGETADSFIEKTTHEIGREKEVVVVTSDNLEQQVTFQRGATRMPSLEFFDEVKRSQKEIKQKTIKNTNPQKNWVSENLSDEILKKLEKIRRSK